MKTFDTELKNKQFFEYYLIYGDEAYLRRTFKNKTLNALMPENQELNYLHVSDEKFKLQDVTSFCDTFSFFADKKLIFMDNLNLFVSGTKKGAGVSKELVSYLEEKPDNVVFLFVESEIDKKSSLYKFISSSKNGRILEVGKQQDSVIYKWINNLFKESDIDIDTKTIAYFVNAVGMNMDNLKNEIDKLVSYKSFGENKKIEISDIDKVTNKNIDGNIYKLVDAISKKNKQEAYKLYRDLLLLREDPMHILALIHFEYKNLLVIKSGLNNHLTQSEIKEKSKLYLDWKYKIYVGIVAGLSIKDIKSGIEMLVDIDEKIKLGLMDKKIALEIFIADACK